MRYIIPYSFSQQNEFYKVYNTKKKRKKKKEKKKSQFHKTVLTLQLQYLCRSIYTNLKNIHPLRRIYHNYLQLTGNSRKLENLPIMLLGHHRMYSSGCSGMKGVRSIHKYLQDLFRLVNFYDNK